MDYNFNAANRNLIQRDDVTNSRNEVFGYDNLHRLDSIRLNSGSINRMTYYSNGNINTKFDVGTYQYANSNHAISGITNKASSYSPPVLDIGYTSYNRISSLTRQGSVVKRLDFQYNPDNQRNKTLYYENNTLKKTTYYIGNYEKEVIQGGSTKEYDYICTPDGLSAIAVKTNGSRSLYYVNTDHLGSIRTVTTASKAVQTRYYYDAWGKQTLLSGTSITNRGYTGEEHLSDFGLINLNARLYDPALGRFLEIDPYVSSPDFTQAFNRYSYALNNPLCYVDRDGENPLLFFIIGGALIGSYVGSSIKGGSWNPAKWEGNWWQGSIYGGIAGAFVGAGIGSIWMAGGSISFSMSAYGLNSVELLSFSAASASAGSGVTMTVGGGLGLGSALTYTFGRKENPVSQEPTMSIAEIDQILNNINQMQWKEKSSDLGIGFYAGTGLTAASEALYSKDLGTWMGKNGKFYDQSWGGNQYTGGKYKFAQKWATPFKYGSNALGWYGVGSSIVDGFKGEISPKVATGDVIFGGAAIYSGFWGGWANLWYNLGKEYGPMTTYLRLQEAKRNRRY